MTVVFEPDYTLPVGDYPLTHARIAHNRNWLSGGITSNSDEPATGYFKAGPDNTLTFEKWKPVDLSDFRYWEYTHTEIADCDYCCILMQEVPVGPEIDIRVQYYDENTWISVSAITETVGSLYWFTFTPTRAQRWRVRFRNNIDNTGWPVVVVKFGKALQMPRPLFQGHTPFGFERNTEMRSLESETGEFLGATVQRRFVLTSYAWQNLDPTWIRANFFDLQAALEEEPFFIAWRPNGYPEVGFCRAQQSPKATNTGPRDLMDLTIGNVRGVVYV